MKKLIFPLSFLLVTIIACDKIDDPIPNDFVNTDGINWDDSLFTESNNGMRKILVEEFTGHLCTYCPNGAREIDRLDSVYDPQVIAMSIHAGNFAVPASGVDINSDLVFDYTTDFRDASGEAYFSAFGVAANPAATVSRLNNANITGLSQWDVDIQTIINDAPKVKIGLSTLYDDSSRTVKAVVSTEWLSNEAGNYNLQLYLVEDSIVDWQLDNSVHIQFYTHRHVFRKALNGTWGTPIPSSNLGDIDTQEHAIELDPSWDKKHCSIIAHVYSSAPNYEVLQAEELYIVDH